MRSRTLFDRHGAYLEIVDDEVVWVRPDKLEPEPDAGPQVVRDLAPYQSMIDGSVIDGRKRHRDHLKAHRCVEVGNDTTHLKRAPLPIQGRKESLHRMLADVGERDLQRIVKREIQLQREIRNR